jgi:hypothetical protein
MKSELVAKPLHPNTSLIVIRRFILVPFSLAARRDHSVFANEIFAREVGPLPLSPARVFDGEAVSHSPYQGCEEHP